MLKCKKSQKSEGKKREQDKKSKEDIKVDESR